MERYSEQNQKAFDILKIAVEGIYNDSDFSTLDLLDALAQHSAMVIKNVVEEENAKRLFLETFDLMTERLHLDDQGKLVILQPSWELLAGPNHSPLNLPRNLEDW